MNIGPCLLPRQECERALDQADNQISSKNGEHFQNVCLPPQALAVAGCCRRQAPGSTGSTMTREGHGKGLRARQGSVCTGRGCHGEPCGYTSVPTWV